MSLIEKTTTKKQLNNKKKNYSYMTSISKIVYIVKLDDIVNKYSNAHHRTIKIKSVDVNSSTYIEFNFKNSNDKHPKLEAGDNINI